MDEEIITALIADLLSLNGTKDAGALAERIFNLFVLLELIDFDRVNLTPRQKPRDIVEDE